VPGIVWFALKALFMFFMFAMVKAIVHALPLRTS